MSTRTSTRRSLRWGKYFYDFQLFTRIFFQFTDVARQLETFFLQKRFTIYNHKPEMILKEDTGELKAELVGPA